MNKSMRLYRDCMKAAKLIKSLKLANHKKMSIEELALILYALKFKGYKGL